MTRSRLDVTLLGCRTVPPLKHAYGCCFYLPPQGFVQAVARHDVGLAAEDGVFAVPRHHRVRFVSCFGGLWLD